jgi:hypothetical protein
MQISPSYKKVNPPSQTQVLDSHKREVMKDINCVRPGTIVSYNPGSATEAPTATVQIAQMQVAAISPTGVRTIESFPPLPNVPIIFPHGGGFTLTFPIAIGDECLLLFNDREIEQWLLNGAGQAPVLGRTHDLSDAFALVGIRSNPNGLAGISATAVQLRSDNYSGISGSGELVELSSGKIRLIADEIIIAARTKLNLGADGCGVQYLPNAVNTFTDGVTGSHSAPTPPEIAE